jgi:hypothetical protein
MTSGNDRIAGAGGLRGAVWRYRAWWLVPMIGVLLLFLAAVLLGQGDEAEPFIYSLF